MSKLREAIEYERREMIHSLGHKEILGGCFARLAKALDAYESAEAQRWVQLRRALTLAQKQVEESLLALRQTGLMDPEDYRPEHFGAAAKKTLAEDLALIPPVDAVEARAARQASLAWLASMPAHPDTGLLLGDPAKAAAMSTAMDNAPWATVQPGQTYGNITAPKGPPPVAGMATWGHCEKCKMAIRLDGSEHVCHEPYSFEEGKAGPLGRLAEPPPEKCERCRGSGWAVDPKCNDIRGDSHMQCPDCGGSGERR